MKLEHTRTLLLDQERFVKENRKGEKTNKNNNNIFDVIAGTSGGAINASIIVSHVLEKRKQKFDIEDSWRGTLKKLIRFLESHFLGSRL